MMHFLNTLGTKETKRGSRITKSHRVVDVSLSFFLSFFRSFCLSVFLSFCLSVFLSFCLSVFLSFRLSVFLSFCLSVFLSFCLSVFPSFCLSVFLSLAMYVNMYTNILWVNFWSSKGVIWSGVETWTKFLRPMEDSSTNLCGQTILTRFEIKVHRKTTSNH